MWHLVRLFWKSIDAFIALLLAAMVAILGAKPLIAELYTALENGGVHALDHPVGSCCRSGIMRRSTA